MSLAQGYADTTVQLRCYSAGNPSMDHKSPGVNPWKRISEGRGEDWVRMRRDISNFEVRSAN